MDTFHLLFTDKSSTQKGLLDAVDLVKQESRADILAARESITDLNVAFPEISCAIQTSQAIEVLLTTADIMANSLTQSGKIEPKEQENIHEMILKMEQKVRFFPPAFERADPSDIIRDANFLRDLSNEEFEGFLSITEDRFYDRGSVICTQGKMTDGIIILTSGRVKVTYTESHVDDIPKKMFSSSFLVGMSPSTHRKGISIDTTPNKGRWSVDRKRGKSLLEEAAVGDLEIGGSSGEQESPKTKKITDDSFSATEMFGPGSVHSVAAFIWFIIIIYSERKFNYMPLTTFFYRDLY